MTRSVARGGIAGLALAVLALSACTVVDADRARLCRIALPALEPAGTRIAVIRTRPIENGVRIDYRATLGDQAALPRFAACRFALGRRADLEAITTDRGEVPGATVYLLKRYYVETDEGTAADPGPAAPEAGLPDWPAWAALPAQHLLNGMVTPPVLALLAGAFALTQGVSGRINLSLGPLAVVGAAASVLTALAAASNAASLAGLAAGLACGLLLAALLGRLTGWIAFRLVPAAHGQASLIATIGLALALSEGLRLASGTRSTWLPPLGAGPVPVAHAGDALVTVSPPALAATGIGLAAALAVAVLTERSRFGRHWRALAQDAGAAALAGVDRGRIEALALALAGGLAGLAGTLLAFRFGALGFSDGLALGLKALTGAILGGIGSVPAAMAGGALVGLFESLWSMAFPVESRDLALFIALVIGIMLRPAGLFARP